MPSTYAPSIIDRGGSSHIIGTFTAGERLHRVAFSPYAADLVAIGGETTVQVLRVVPKTIRRSDGEERAEVGAVQVARWRLGAPTSTLTWGAKSESGTLELIAVAKTAVYQLHAEPASEDSSDDPVDSERATTIQEIGAGNTEAIHDVAFCPMPDGSNLLAAVVDSGCLIWDLSTDADPTLVSHPHPPRVVEFSQTGAKLATVDDRGTPQMIDLTRVPFATLLTLDEPLSCSKGPLRPHVSISWSNDGSVLGALVNGRWTVWNLKRGSKPAMAEELKVESMVRGKIQWNPVHPQLFAVLSSRSKEGGNISIVSTTFPEVPRPIEFTHSRAAVDDFDWHPLDDGGVMAVVSSRTLYFLRPLE